MKTLHLTTEEQITLYSMMLSNAIHWETEVKRDYKLGIDSHVIKHDKDFAILSAKIQDWLRDVTEDIILIG